MLPAGALLVRRPLTRTELIGSPPATKFQAPLSCWVEFPKTMSESSKQQRLARHHIQLGDVFGGLTGGVEVLSPGERLPGRSCCSVGRRYADACDRAACTRRQQTGTTLERNTIVSRPTNTAMAPRRCLNRKLAKTATLRRSWLLDGMGRPLFSLFNHRGCRRQGLSSEKPGGDNCILIARGSDRDGDRVAPRNLRHNRQG